MNQYVLQETLRWGGVQKVEMRKGTKAVSCYLVCISDVCRLERSHLAVVPSQSAGYHHVADVVTAAY